ncbi:MAG TPA: DUF736 family protein [Sphingomicrobium sp.]|nr:DUF736 family protein [Sphingomicrobium sp.]
MATIGTFTRNPDGSFTGAISTLLVQSNNVRITPEPNRPNEAAPSHRVSIGRADIGAAWPKTSNEGRSYFGLKLDDPSFAKPIYANLFEQEDGKTHLLIWSRQRRAQD